MSLFKISNIDIIKVPIFSESYYEQNEVSALSANNKRTGCLLNERQEICVIEISLVVFMPNITRNHAITNGTGFIMIFDVLLSNSKGTVLFFFQKSLPLAVNAHRVIKQFF